MDPVTEESAIEQNDSFEVFTYTVGGTAAYWLTSYYKNMTIDAQLYTATPGLYRSGFQQTSDSTPTECSISLPSGHPLILLIKNPQAIQQIKVDVERYFTDDLSASELIFSGFAVSGTTLENGMSQISFKDLLHLLDREICRVRVQSLCNNRLFDVVCFLDSADYKISTSYSVGGAGKIITIPVLSPARASGYFSQGRLVYNGISRYITKHDTNTLYLQFPISGMAGSGTIDIYPGCDKTPETCKTKFLSSNLVNFVGMPYVPTKDPGLVPLTNLRDD